MHFENISWIPILSLLMCILIVTMRLESCLWGKKGLSHTQRTQISFLLATSGKSSQSSITLA